MRRLQLWSHRGLVLGSFALLGVVGCANAKFGWRDGLEMESGPVRAQIGARAAVDAVRHDPRNVRDSEVRVDVADVRLHVRHETGYEGRAVLDLVGIDTRGGFREAWVGREFERWFRVRGGLQPVSIGIEGSVPDAERSFVRPSFPAYIADQTDWGLRVDGEYEDGFLGYFVAATAGEGFDRNGERRVQPLVAARLQSYPFRGVSIVDGFFLSGGILHGFDYEGHLDVTNPGRNTLFTVSRIEGEESQYLDLGYGLDLGSVRVWHEWLKGGVRGVDVPGGGEENFAEQITAWTAGASWFVTGEMRDQRLYREGPDPVEPLRPVLADPDDPETTGWGALELAVRYSNGDIDRRFFDLGFTSYTQSSQEFRTFTGAVNWYPIEQARVTAEVVRTIADQTPAAFESHGRDTTFLLRLEFGF